MFLAFDSTRNRSQEPATPRRGLGRIADGLHLAACLAAFADDFSGSVFFSLLAPWRPLSSRLQAPNRKRRWSANPGPDAGLRSWRVAPQWVWPRTTSRCRVWRLRVCQLVASSASRVCLRIQSRSWRSASAKCVSGLVTPSRFESSSDLSISQLHCSDFTASGETTNTIVWASEYKSAKARLPVLTGRYIAPIE